MMKDLEFIKLQSESAAVNPWSITGCECSIYQTYTDASEKTVCVHMLSAFTVMIRKNIAHTSCMFGRQAVL